MMTERYQRQEATAVIGAERYQRQEAIAAIGAERYQRQEAIDAIGAEGQKKLAAKRVTVIGAGGLGSPVLTYLAQAGVGTLRLIDFDTVGTTNLNRQFSVSYTHLTLPTILLV